MSQIKRNYRQTGYGRSNYAGGRNRDAYIDGNTVRKFDVVREIEEPLEEYERPVKRTRKGRQISFGYSLFLVAALCACALILVNYVELKAELTNRTRSVAAKESYLNTLKVANDEEYNRIINSVDLEEVKRVAIGELGMVYAKEGQIILYENEGNDYMRQVCDGK